MVGSWFVGNSREDIWLVAWFGGARGPANVPMLEAETACFRVEEWFPEGMLSRLVLAGIVGHLERHIVDSGSGSTPWLRDRVVDALRRGRLIAYARPRIVETSGGSQGAAPVQASERPPPPREESTWIAIKLADRKGKPVAYKRYRIELPDGSRREGMLDASGMARLDGIDPGTCEVSFPDLDGSDWKTA
jgi:hypothetical protein